MHFPTAAMIEIKELLTHTRAYTLSQVYTAHTLYRYTYIDRIPSV